MASEFLTTRELAELLRIKERKVYDLVAAGEVPCSKATGKLLFPRAGVEAWLAQNTTGVVSEASVAGGERPGIVLGSHDPLLDWALRESRSGLATIYDGSMDGLERFENHEGLATGLHIYEPDHEGWNRDSVAQRFAGQDVVLIEWAKRVRGLLLKPDLAGKVKGMADLEGRSVVPRQKGAGSQVLFEILLARAKLKADHIDFTQAARTETDAALAVQEEKADAAFGLEDQARQFGLAFCPVTVERFDLLIDRQAYFERPLQALLAFCRSEAFVEKEGEMAGYDVGELGRVHWNG